MPSQLGGDDLVGCDAPPERALEGSAQRGPDAEQIAVEVRDGSS
jgi:hypothetical protein